MATEPEAEEPELGAFQQMGAQAIAITDDLIGAVLGELPPSLRTSSSQHTQRYQRMVALRIVLMVALVIIGIRVGRR